MSSYRNDIDNSTYKKESVKYVLDDIENRIDGIQDMLKNIHGLTEIDIIKELLNDLAKDLY